jgi:hypothetical protein
MARKRRNIEGLEEAVWLIMGIPIMIIALVKIIFGVGKKK